MSTGSTRQWRRLRAKVIQEEPLCRIRLPGCTHRSNSVDHIIPLSVRPDLRYVRANLRGACKSCNCRRGNRPIHSPTRSPRRKRALALAVFDTKPKRSAAQ